ncbi:MAG: ABC transporter permease [Bryobacteraceae bacterium]
MISRPLVWLVLLVGLYVAAAPRVAPYPPSLQQRAFPFVPPMSLHWKFAGLFTFPLYYCGLQPEGEAYREDCGQARRFEWWGGGRLLRPEAEHPFFLMGSDGLGRDQFSRLVEGGRVTLVAGVVAAGIAVLIGMLVGLFAGYGGLWVDGSVSAITTLVLTCPWIYLLLAIRSMLPLSMPQETALLVVMGVSAGVGWPRPAILFRALVKTAKEREFVLLSRTFGGGQWHIFRTHLIPQLRHAAVAQFTTLAPQFVLAETTLSFLGLGVQEPGVSWGILLSALRDVPVLFSHTWMALPCIPIAGVFFLMQWGSRLMQYTDES